VTSIGDGAFRDCTSLTTVTSLAADAPSLGDQVFDNTNLTEIIVPVGATLSYETAGNGTTYGNLIITETT